MSEAAGCEACKKDLKLDETFVTKRRVVGGMGIFHKDCDSISPITTARYEAEIFAKRDCNWKPFRIGFRTACEILKSEPRITPEKMLELLEDTWTKKEEEIQ